jgi:serine/threonine protein kinase
MDKETAEFTKIKYALAFQREFDCVGDKPLGKGAFGHVVKAICRKEGRAYAIKVITKDAKVKYQERELKALITFKLSEDSKQNVIEYFASWTLQVGDERRLCIQMELCSVSLDNFVYENEMGGPKIIQAQGPPRFYHQVFQQILSGLAFIHSIRWVHRDIHPGNILVVNPNPQQISDIHVKIADFGLARHIGVEIEYEVVGLTIVPKLEKVSQFPGNALFRAPELRTDTYDFKVDVYSAGIMLYFISRYLENKNEWNTELKDLKQRKFEPKERIFYKDEKLSTLINNLLQEDPNARLSARRAKEYMFPTQTTPKDSTDAKESMPKIPFIVRKENEQDFSQCCLNQFTLSAITAEVERGTGVKRRRQVLREERMVQGEKKRIKIEHDDNVKDIFNIAAQKERDVVVVVIEQPEEDDNLEIEEFSSVETVMEST